MLYTKIACFKTENRWTRRPTQISDPYLVYVIMYVVQSLCTYLSSNADRNPLFLSVFGRGYLYTERLSLFQTLSPVPIPTVLKSTIQIRGYTGLYVLHLLHVDGTIKIVLS
jgi:hypothetical protein